jgi:hypothetical protein
MVVTDRNGDSIQRVGEYSESVFSTSEFGSECAALTICWQVYFRLGYF